MSDPVSALNGASYSGTAQINEAGPRGMITLRGDLAVEAVQSAVWTGCGLTVPTRREAILSGDQGVLWMSPDEVMILLPYADAGAAVTRMQAALAGVHGLVADVSDARAVFRLSGSGTREVLAKLAPVDLSPSAFAPGEVRRTRLAQVPAAFWMLDDQTAELICFRSVANYVFDLLSNAAHPSGKIGIFQGPDAF
ncbi:sarcosine oxidase subunit gamma [Actibacterium sp.]|uniref:sarcosine oxidase subunit gamma n=1 Tax=Actibacterium sp. TaxID=1872125 RepID=UPI00356361C7